MAHAPVVWHGSAQECLELLHALRQHCQCRRDGPRLVRPCSGHIMLAEDQRAIDGLVFMHRLAPRLLAEEFASAD
jgi:hypothetical protein